MKTLTINALSSSSSTFHLRTLKKPVNPDQDQARHDLSGAEKWNMWRYPKCTIFLSLLYCSAKVFGIIAT